MTKLVYFAWVRERIGLDEEELDVPTNVTTGRELLDWLKTRSDEHAFALEHSDAIRIAVNQEHIHHSEALGDAQEIALFPPMTGG